MNGSSFFMHRLLFISWDGPQVNYLESLFLPIFSRLREYGIEVHVLHLTWSKPDRVDNNKLKCKKYNVGYTHIPIHFRLGILGQVLACFRAIFYLFQATRRAKFDCLMPRSIIPGMICLLSSSFCKLPIIFDADGLAFDEKVDFQGLNPSSLIYRLFRDIEAQLVRLSKKTLVRTSKAAEILLARSGPGVLITRFSVISNARDSTLFRPSNDLSRAQARAEIGIAPQVPLLIYVGSVGPQYCFSEMLEIFRQFHQYDNSAKLLILTLTCDQVIPYLSSFNDIREHIIIMSSEPVRVPRLVAAADVGLAVRSTAFSMQAVSPIKIGEYLLCGVPVIASGIESISSFHQFDVIKVLHDSSSSSVDSAVAWIRTILNRDKSEVQFVSRSLGILHFSLNSMASKFAQVIRSSLQSNLF